VTRSVALDLVPPLFSSIPEYDFTLGPEVFEVASMAGLVPDPEQALILDATFGVRDGKSAARDIGVCAPRQNLKTGTLKCMALGWLYVTEERLIVWSAHEFGTAQEAFRDMCELIESTPDLDREVKQIHRGNGDEAIELTHDRRLKFKARTKGGGRGLTGNRIVLDEAMYLKAAHMGALVPTLRAVRDPQLVFAGSAGMGDSHVWRSIRDRGREGGDPSLAWNEWASDAEPGGCADGDECTHRLGVDGCALDDTDRLLRSNSAIGRRITLETLAADRRTMPAEEYARETLGWWDPPDDDDDADIFTEDQWLACAEPDSVIFGSFAFGIDVAPDGNRAAIAVAGRTADGMAHVAVVDAREGTTWVPARLAELLEKHQAKVALDPAGPAGALLKDLTTVGVEPEQIKARELVQTCGWFYNLVESGDLRHRDEAALFEAVVGVKKRPVGDAWAWARKEARNDITPLYAATLALWCHATHGGAAEPGVWFI
jgi:hypothetical protein